MSVTNIAQISLEFQTRFTMYVDGLQFKVQWLPHGLQYRILVVSPILCTLCSYNCILLIAKKLNTYTAEWTWKSLHR